MSNKIIKNYKPTEVINLDNAPVYGMNIKEWERAQKNFKNLL